MWTFCGRSNYIIAIITSSSVKGSVGNRNLSTAKKATYQAYLIRCWYEDGSWRFALETIGPDRQQRAFTTLARLTAHIQSRLNEVARLLSSDR